MKMFSFIIILSTFFMVLSDTYKQLSKHGSVKVNPNTKVYFDIGSFETGDLISFEIKMDLFFGTSSSRESYTFFIEQVPANTYYDSKYWNNLRQVINKNVSCSSSSDCTFSWEEIKEEGKNFIYIIPPTPFDDFTFWDEKIKIIHLGGLSAGAIVGIVFGCIAIVGIMIAMFACCCCRYNPTCNTCCLDCCPCCACCACCCNCYRGPRYGIGGTTVVSVPPPVIQAQVPPPVYAAEVYPQPGYVQPVYQVNPYSSSAIMYN